MILAADAGNTRFKWGLADGGEWRARGAIATAELSALPDQLPDEPVELAVIANVAGEAVRQRLDAALRDRVRVVHWARSVAAQCGVRNGYETPGQLGVDRWAALIGARSLHDGDCVVVCSGTATTVDMLDASGAFRGGLILPGLALMRTALAGGTAQLPLLDGSHSAFPRNTADAIYSGCCEAQAGAIERMFGRLQSPSRAICMLSGGAADALVPLLRVPVRHVEDLVLRGLLCIGRSL